MFGSAPLGAATLGGSGSARSGAYVLTGGQGVYATNGQAGTASGSAYTLTGTVAGTVTAFGGAAGVQVARFVQGATARFRYGQPTGNFARNHAGSFATVTYASSGGPATTLHTWGLAAAAAVYGVVGAVASFSMAILWRVPSTAITLYGFPAALRRGYTLTASSARVGTIGGAGALQVIRSLAAARSTYLFKLADAALRRGLVLPAAAGTIAARPAAAVLARQLRIAAAAGSVTSGSGVVGRVGRRLTAPSASYALAAAPASMLPKFPTLNGQAATFSLQGAKASCRVAHLAIGQAGTYTIIGGAATFQDLLPQPTGSTVATTTSSTTSTVTTTGGAVPAPAATSPRNGIAGSTGVFSTSAPAAFMHRSYGLAGGIGVYRLATSNASMTDKLLGITKGSA